MLKLVANKKELRDFIKFETMRHAKDYRKEQIEVHKYNVDRVYPCFATIQVIDNTQMNGDLDILVWFYPLTKEIKRKVLESLI